MAFALPLIATLATVGGTVAGISAQRTAAKRAKGQAEQAGRVRAGELRKAGALPKRAETLPAEAKVTAKEEVLKRRRRRTTLVTGPRGLLGEPATARPTLLGA